MSNNRVVFITGASSGIGKACAKILALNRFKVYGTSRKVSVPEKVNGYTLLKMDVTDDNSINSAIEYILKKEGRIDVLINNAGIVYSGPLVMHNKLEIEKQLETNFFGVVNMVNKIFPVMYKQNKGLIINISSIGGVMGLPFQGAYSASKFAIEGYSESLRLELEKFNIKVVVVRPGDIKTKVVQNRIKYEKFQSDTIFKNQYIKSLKVIEKEELNGIDPEKVAYVILKILNTNKIKPYYIVANPIQRLSVFAKKVLSAKIFDKIISIYYHM